MNREEVNKGVVIAVQIIVLVMTAGFVIALFTNGSGAGTGTASGAYGNAKGPRTGAQIYQSSCAVCHGPDGEGGVGPELGGGAVVEAFPDVADQIVVVTNGRGAMPSFNRTLSTQEIQAVVDYTRKGLG
jgi:mono/diheme cytochrome c family protein